MVVDILLEKIINKQSRYTFSGSSLDLNWTHETRVQTVETHRYKGTQTEVQAYLDSTGQNNTVLRKSDGPWYETDVIQTTETPWQTVAQG
jgi:hypothetical protein